MIKTHESLVYLEPIEHKYHHRKTGKIYTSVTKVLSSIEPHFDAESISEAIVKQPDTTKQERYIGMSQSQILEYWQMLNDEANVYGTKVHDFIEKYLKADKWLFTKDPLENKIIEGYDSLNIEEGVAMYPERIMFSEEYELAGMSDLIIDIDEVFFDVLDYKTNRVFNYYNPFGYQTLLPPFEHLQNCQWSIYTLQLSIYAYMYMLEHPRRKCRQILVLYWDKKSETFSKIPIMFLKNEAKVILDLHKYNTLYK